MSSIRPKLIGALVGSLAALAVAGGGLAFAQESPSTTEPPTAETPATPAPDSDPDPGREDCPEKDGAGDDSSTSL
ncbi:MAG: hypothetical protein ACRD0N_04475 [Acidimicrobiales bacterium]